MILKNQLQEITFTVIIFVWLMFVATNVNITLGQTYLLFTSGIFILYIITTTIFDKRLDITFAKKQGGTLSAILWGVAGWIILLIASVIIMKFIDPSKANIASVIALMGAVTPSLATSKIANLLTFGVAVAFVETQFWSRLLEFFSDIFKINTKKITIGLLFLIAILSLAFVAFHLTAKGITNIPSLAIVFVMMTISLIMVSIFGESRQAVYLHIFANTVASYLMLFALGKLQILGGI